MVKHTAFVLNLNCTDTQEPQIPAQHAAQTQAFQPQLYEATLATAKQQATQLLPLANPTSYDKFIPSLAQQIQTILFPTKRKLILLIYLQSQPAQQIPTLLFLTEITLKIIYL
jgi:hypothetical protein